MSPLSNSVIASAGSVVRHLLVTESPVGTKDKFRIDFYQEKKLVGKKYIFAIVSKDSSHPHEQVTLSVQSSTLLEPFSFAIQDSGEFRELATPPIPKPVHQHWNVSKETRKTLLPTLLLSVETVLI